MTLHAPLLDSAWAERIGWTLVHSVWQVAVVAAAFAVASFALRRRSANARYVLACLALVAMVAWPGATFLQMPLPTPSADPPAAFQLTFKADPVSVAAVAGPSEPAEPASLDPAPQPSLELTPPIELRSLWSAAVDWLASSSARVEPALPWLATGWLVGVAMLALRPLWGLVVVRRLKTRGLAPLSTELRKLAGRLLVQLRIARAVQFAESALVEVPTVIGYLRPMVLLPASAITGLSTEQLELVIAHELAHVRRHDYLVNLLQTLIEALLFYHPGMWWVSAQVRRERENCCDDVAVSVCDNRREYVRALYALELRRGAGVPALAASGGSLVERVRRLVLGPPAATALDRTAAWLAGLIALAVVAVVLSLGQSYADDAAIEPPSEAEAPIEEAEVSAPAEVDEVAKERSLDDIIASLPTYADCTIKKALQARIIIAADEVRERGEGHVIVGRVLVEGDDDPTDVNAQMEILGGGYFAGPVLDLHHPVGFRMHGYAPYDLELSGDDERVVDVGTIQMRRLPDGELVPVVGRVELEGGGDLSTVSLSFTASNGPVNTPSHGTEPRSRWPDVVAIQPDANGRIYQPGFSPIDYHLVVTAPGYVRQDQPVSIADNGAMDLGTIRVEKPLPITVDYIVTEALPFNLAEAKTASLEGGSRWQVTPREHGWDLEFDQKRGQLYFDWSHGPVFLAHLGPGELADYLGADGRVATRQPRDFTVINGHVYLLRRPNWEQGNGEYFALFKVRSSGGAEPTPDEVLGPTRATALSKPWIAVGQVTDESGEPMVGVEVKAFAGVGTLRNTGSTSTDKSGQYRLNFGPGILFERGSNRVQAATIRAQAPGYFEQNLNRQGNCVAGFGPATGEDLELWDRKPEHVFLPGEPKLIDFVMRPAAVLEGEFVETSSNRNVSDQGFFLVGEELPPSQNVLESATTDNRGRFRVDSIPTGREWRIGMRVPHTWVEIETPPLRFAEPGVYRCKLVLDARGGDGGVEMSLRVEDLEQIATAEQVHEIDRLDEEGFSKLHRAASGGNVERVRELLKAGANVDVQQGTYRGTPLQYAAGRGHGDTVQTLIDHHATIDAQDTNGRTPLVWAAMKGHADVIRRLLEAGAAINARNAGGWTPLHYAVSNGHEEAAQLLIDRGADVRARNSQDKTPVDLNPNLNLRIPWRALEQVEPPTTPRESPASRPNGSLMPLDPVRTTAADTAASPEREPDAVVAVIHDRPIAWREIAPTPEWLDQRDRAGGRGFELPADQALSRLREQILTPLFDAYRQENSLEPTDAEIDEYVIHYRRAQQRSLANNAQELARLRQEVAEAEQQYQALNLSPDDYAALEQKIGRGKKQIESFEQLAKAQLNAMEGEKARQLARWMLNNWKLQQSLYKKYGGRAIFQQLGPEALDAMRDYLKEQEAAGEFAIRDPQLREQFWEYFTNDRMHVFVPDPDRIFEQPWSALESGQ